jgi:hypothetical protein
MRFARHLATLCIATSLVTLLIGTPLHAQQPSVAPTSPVVPRLVNFSGKATDAQGKVISGIAGITLAIYKDQYEGSPLWVEAQNIQADLKGNYTVQLGATKSEGLPLDLFTSGEARWLGVTINDGQEQPRVLLLSVPYALKAADAETVGGLPASAFVLAAPVADSTTASPGASAASPAAAPPPPATSNVVTSGGAINAIPLWSTATDIQNSVLTQTGSGTTAKIGVNTTAPATTLDVNGAETVRGALTLPATATATATKGAISQPQNLVASSFSSSSNSAVSQKFQWQAEPANNNTANPAATLNLLYGSGTTAPGETGLRIGPKGVIGFVPSQTFPGTISNVEAGTDLTGGGSGGTVTLNLDTTKVPQLNSVNTFTGNQGVIGTVTVTGSLGVGTGAPQASLDVFSSTVGDHAPIGKFGSSGANDCNSILTYTGSGTTEIFQAGAAGCFIPGAVQGDSGLRVSPGNRILLGDSSANRVLIDGAGNVEQQRTAGGFVKAMLHFSPFNSGRIISCYNSTLSGAAATTPPCGFLFDITGVGDYIFDFGFEVDDRIYSATSGTQAIGSPPSAFPISVDTCGNQDGQCLHTGTLTNNQVEVGVYNIGSGGSFTDSKIHLIVF